MYKEVVLVDQEGYQKDNSSNSAHAGSDEWLLRRVYRQTTSLRQSGTEKVRGHTAYLASKDHGPRQGSSAQGQQRKPSDGARNEQHVPRCRGDFQPLPAVDSICFRTAWDEYVRGNVHSADGRTSAEAEISHMEGPKAYRRESQAH